MPEFGSFLLIGAVAAAVTFATTPLVGLLAHFFPFLFAGLGPLPGRWPAGRFCVPLLGLGTAC